MSNKVIVLADMKPEGSSKTYRELNNELQHAIPLNSLVQMRRYGKNVNGNSDYIDNTQGMILRVAKHGRDCDGTPLYYMSHMKAEDYESRMAFVSKGYMVLDGMNWKGELFGPLLYGGFGKDAIKLIALPEDVIDED